MTRHINFVSLAAIFLSSFAVAAFAPLDGISRAVAAAPAFGAAFAAVFQLVRDRMAHDREVSLQATQHSFAFGATSHMANVAFDKHVAFSEKYVAEVYRSLKTLFREGPTEEALPHAWQLVEIRREWAL